MRPLFVGLPALLAAAGAVVSRKPALEAVGGALGAGLLGALSRFVTVLWPASQGVLEERNTGKPAPDALISRATRMSVRLIVDGAVYMLAAREAMALVRRLRYRGSWRSSAIGAAVVLEWALAQERAPGVSFTLEEAREVVRAAGRSDHALYRTLRRKSG